MFSCQWITTYIRVRNQDGRRSWLAVAQICLHCGKMKAGVKKPVKNRVLGEPLL